MERKRQIVDNFLKSTAGNQISLRQQRALVIHFRQSFLRNEVSWPKNMDPRRKSLLPPQILRAQDEINRNNMLF